MPGAIALGDAIPGVLPTTPTPTPRPPPALPEAPAAALYPYKILERKPGVDREWTLGELWRSNDRPSALGVAAAGAGACGLAGYMRSSLSGKFAIAAATNLQEVDGRLRGRIAAAGGALPEFEVVHATGVWYRLDDFVFFGSSTRQPSNTEYLDLLSPDDQPFSFKYTTTRAGYGSQIAYVRGTIQQLAQGGFIQRWDSLHNRAYFSVREPLPFADVNGARIIARNTGESLSKATVDTLRVALRTAALREINPATLTNIPMTWEAAYQWALLGKWLRRISWSDLTQQVRCEPGWGTTPAPLVIQSSAIAKRVVRNTDFGPVELLAQDWVLCDVPGETQLELDLTDARLVLRGGEEYILFASLEGSVTPPGPEGGGCCCACP